MSFDYERIPQELRWWMSWCVAGPDDKGTFKAPHTPVRIGLVHASPVDKTHWRDFETVLESAAKKPGCGIGFILSEEDPYVCIDLDVKNSTNEKDPTKWTTQEVIDRHWAIVKAFDSYTELSASGLGLHIWIRGKLGLGCRRDGVEVYSQERFMVCTGNVVISSEIRERQELLDILVSEIRNVSAPAVTLTDIDEIETDEIILERAALADNKDKYLDLYNGGFANYPSQSEADLALMSIYTFYSKSNQQCRRLFRTSKLADRDKALVNDAYLNRTLRIIRSRQAVDDEITEAAAITGKALFESMQATAHASAQAAQTPMQVVAPAQTLAQPTTAVIMPHSEPQKDDGPGLPWPPGCMGEIARYIYSNAPRPVKEVAIVAAIGLLAGVCGKTFSIPQSGLNVYVILLGQSAIGKESMHSGISSLMLQIQQSVPSAFDFVDFTEYASGPALSKAVIANPCFLNVSSEWGRRLRRLGQEGGDGPMQQLRTTMTSLYQKSGPTSIVGGIGYSDKEKNTASVSGVAYSMIGESTPGVFYDALTDDMMEDGFLSRFTMIEFTGQRPPANQNIQNELTPFLKEHLSTLFIQSLTLLKEFKNTPVDRDDEAREILHTFDLECDSEINSTDEEAWRQMWNRAHLKVCRIAALLAVGDNCLFPIINKVHCEWALEVVRRDIGIMRRRISSGDVGVGDATREKKVLNILRNYLLKEPAASQAIPKGMREAGIVPRKLLQNQTQKVSSFTSHRLGQNGALEATIGLLISSGYIVEADKGACMRNFDFSGKAYSIVVLPSNTQEKKVLTAARKNSL